jgi:hypothetical protein
MKKYFEVTVDVVVGQTASGKDKIHKERYLVDAQTVTEAEARVIKTLTTESIQLDYTISSAKESRIERVIE